MQPDTAPLVAQQQRQHLPLTLQIRAALDRGGSASTVEEVLADVEMGRAGIVAVPGSHVIYRWIGPGAVEIISLFGDMELVREFHAVSRMMGARRWEWYGRHGWGRVLQMLEADYGRE